MKKLAAVLLVLALGCGARPERRLTEAELRMIATARSMTEWGLPGLDARAETIETVSNMDGSLRVTCTYDSDRVPEPRQALYHVSAAQFFPTEIAAKDAFRRDVAAYRKGVARVEGRSVRDAAALLKMGDEQYAAFMLHGDKPIGNIFVIRRGRVLHSLIVSRVYFDEPDGIRRLFAPMLAAAKTFENT